MDKQRLQSIAQALFATDEPPDLGPGPRADVKDPPALEAWMQEVLSGASLTDENLRLTRALTHLWHDHLEASHELAQQIHNADGSYVHGIMHRREPDYGNASYWFRKVGDHPAFQVLTPRVLRLLDDRNAAQWRAQLAPRDVWDPFAFIDACKASERGGGSGDTANILREIQALEFEALFERFLG